MYVVVRTTELAYVYNGIHHRMASSPSTVYTRFTQVAVGFAILIHSCLSLIERGFDSFIMNWPVNKKHLCTSSDCITKAKLNFDVEECSVIVDVLLK